MEYFYAWKRGIALLLLATVTTMTAKLHAQPYSFSHFSAPYAEFSDGTILDPLLVCDDDNAPVVPIGFTFTYLGMPLDSFHVHKTFLLREMDVAGVTNGAQFFPLWVNHDCLPNSFTTDLTEVSWKTTGTAGNQVFVVQWKNLGIYDDSTGLQRMNAQALFYESDGAIEFRFGYVSILPMAYIDSQPGGFTALIRYKLDPQNNIALNPNSMNLTGIAVDPTAGLYDENAPVTTLTGVPDSSRVYRFGPPNASLDDHQIADVSLYPNPAQTTVTVAALPGTTAQILTLNGKCVQTTFLASAETMLDISELESGVYFVRISGSNSTMRLVKL